MKKSKQIKLQRIALDVCALKLHTAMHTNFKLEVQNKRSGSQRDSLAKRLTKQAKTINMQRREISNLEHKVHNKQAFNVNKINECITMRGIIEDQSQEIDDLKDDVQNLVERDNAIRTENEALITRALPNNEVLHELLFDAIAKEANDEYAGSHYDMATAVLKALRKNCTGGA